MSQKSWSNIVSKENEKHDGYSEYGYRGLPEIQKWQNLATEYRNRINQLEEENKKLKQKLKEK